MPQEHASNSALLDPESPAEASVNCDAELSLDEVIELKQLEGEIERGLKHFVAVGNALGSIRDRRLYRPAYATFEDYCERRWQIARSRAYQYIESAEVFENVQHVGQIAPENSRQAHALSPIKDPDQQREVWSRAVDTAPDGRITAKHVAEVVRQFQGNPETPSEPAVWTLDDAVEHLGSRLYAISQRWPQEHLKVMADQLRCLADELATYGELRS